ncbi:hypothetical protein HKD37_01G000963 [Glycine soja]
MQEITCVELTVQNIPLILGTLITNTSSAGLIQLQDMSCERTGSISYNLSFPLALVGEFICFGSHLALQIDIPRGVMLAAIDAILPPRVFDRRLQEDWASDAGEGPRILMSLRIDFGSMGKWCLQSPFLLLHSTVIDLQEAKDSIDEENPRPTSSTRSYIMWYQEHLHLDTFVHVFLQFLAYRLNFESNSWNWKGGLVPSLEEFESRNELSSLKLWKEKLERKEKGKERVEINQDGREQIREEERRKIKELKKEKHASYSSHDSCKSLSEELRDYYEGRHRSYLRRHSHRRGKERKPKEETLTSHTSIGRTMVEQQLIRKSTSKSYGFHSYPKKDQGQGILGVTPSKPKDDKGKTIEKHPPKARPTSSTWSYIKGQPLMVKEECKEVSVFFKSFVISHALSELCDVCVCWEMNLIGLGTMQSYPPRALDRRLQSTKFRALLSLSLYSFPSSSKLLSMASYGDPVMQSYPARALDRRLQEDWTRDAREGPRVLISLRVVTSPIIFLPSPFHCHDLQEAKDSIDEEDPRPSSFTWSYITLALDTNCWNNWESRKGVE